MMGKKKLESLADVLPGWGPEQRKEFAAFTKMSPEEQDMNCTGRP
jgi:hypothetical protein